MELDREEGYAFSGRISATRNYLPGDGKLPHFPSSSANKIWMEIRCNCIRCELIWKRMNRRFDFKGSFAHSLLHSFLHSLLHSFSRSFAVHPFLQPSVYFVPMFIH